MHPLAWQLPLTFAVLVVVVALVGFGWDALRRRSRAATLLASADTEARARGRLHYWVHVGDSSNQ